MVGLNDFNAPGTFLGSLPFQASPQFNLALFDLDVTSSLQALLDNANNFAEFRVESESPTVFINAGETDPNSGHSINPNWPGPRLTLTFEETAAVPEPASLLLLGGGLAGAWMRRKKRT